MNQHKVHDEKMIFFKWVNTLFEIGFEIGKAFFITFLGINLLAIVIGLVAGLIVYLR